MDEQPETEPKAEARPQTHKRWYLAGLGVVLLLVAAVFIRPGADHSADADRDSVIAPDEPRPDAIVSAEAKQVLDAMRAAYQKLKTAEFTGTVKSNVDADGQQENSETKFVSSFAEPDTFRHTGEGDLAAGSNGDKLFVFNETAKEYLLIDAPKEGGVEQMPPIIAGLLQAQNPSLLFALLPDPTTQFTKTFATINRAPDLNLDGKNHPALVLEPHEKDGNLTLVFDPETHLLRQLRVDLRPTLQSRGLSDIKVAEAVVDYTSTKTGVQFGAEHFAWTPPQDARDVTASLNAAEEPAESDLLGKPAPDFQLTGLDGQSVSLADLKGQVVVLDFWASWCAPCRESLPHLGKLHAEKRDGVKVFAVNLREDKAKVEAFLKSQNVDLPVLLDSDGAIADKYNVVSIPQTVVIGKDGTVKKVLVGLDEEAFQTIRNEINGQGEQS